MSDFEKFWLAYPKRKGQNPKAPAEKKYQIAIKNGASPEHLLSSARRYADELREQGIYETQFVCQTVTWLNQKRWLAYAPDAGEKAAKIDAEMAKRGYRWNGDKWEKVNGLATD